jgi:hypothetical protein
LKEKVPPEFARSKGGDFKAPVSRKVLVAVSYLAAGGGLIDHPAFGVTGLTLVRETFLFAEGIAARPR